MAPLESGHIVNFGAYTASDSNETARLLGEVLRNVIRPPLQRA